MEKAKALDKIRKCLRLARSSNPHEAAAALRQAQALMREYGVDDAELLASEAREARARSRAARNPVDWEVMLANMIAACFGCEIIFRGGLGLRGYGAFFRRNVQHGEYAFIGAGVHAEIAAYAFAVLLRQAARARAQYIATKLKRCGPASKTRRADEFCRYWTVAVNKKVAALVPTTQQALAVAAYRAKHYPSTLTSEGRERSAGQLADRLHGFTEGERARLHHGVGGSAAPQIESKEAA